eukprot:jgi/Mesvir1/18559/Mv25666-RA.2
MAHDAFKHHVAFISTLLLIVSTSFGVRASTDTSAQGGSDRGTSIKILRSAGGPAEAERASSASAWSTLVNSTQQGDHEDDTLRSVDATSTSWHANYLPDSKDDCTAKPETLVIMPNVQTDCAFETEPHLIRCNVATLEVFVDGRIVAAYQAWRMASFTAKETAAKVLLASCVESCRILTESTVVPIAEGNEFSGRAGSKPIQQDPVVLRACNKGSAKRKKDEVDMPELTSTHAASNAPSKRRAGFRQKLSENLPRQPMNVPNTMEGGPSTPAGGGMPDTRESVNLTDPDVMVGGQSSSLGVREDARTCIDDLTGRDLEVEGAGIPGRHRHT